MSRPVKKWIIIELSEQGEEASYPELVYAIQSIFGADVETFIPIHYEKIGSYTSTNVLFDGYIFIVDSQQNRMSLMEIKDSKMFAGPLKVMGRIQTLNSAEISDLKQKLRNSLNRKFKPGSVVRVCDGTFANLEGEILNTEDNGKISTVKIVCQSREMIVPIPSTCLISQG
jgi:transcription antitermination factor NusG